MNNIVYKKKHYVIIHCGRDYIVQNTDCRHEFKHTHVSNFHVGRLIIDTCLLGEIPRRAKHLERNKRFIVSVLRVCKGKDRRKFDDMLQNNINNMNKCPVE